MTHDRLSATFSALADPTRRAILARLTTGEVTVKELAGPFKMSAPAISKHLKVLERAGLISRGREAQWRPCVLEVAPLQEATSWMEQYRKFWEESFDRLDAYLQKMQAQEKDQQTAAKKKKNARESKKSTAIKPSTSSTSKRKG